MKVLLVGDTHCDTRFAHQVIDLAKDLEVQTIIQLGDFCLRIADSFLLPWQEWLWGDESRNMFWLDGNHDDHSYIDSVIMDGEVHDTPVESFGERFWYCPRGSVTKLGDTTVQFMGGAYSIDKNRRTPGLDWWPQETITAAQVEFAIENSYDVDVICSHDCPDTIWFGGKLDEGDYKVDRASAHNRLLLTHVVNAVSPREVYHGHYHEAYETDMVTNKRDDTRVIGLGANVKHDNRGAYKVDIALDDNVRLVEW